MWGMCISLCVCVCVFAREYSELREEAPQLTSQGLKAAVCLPVCREREGGGQEGALGKRSGRAVWKKRKQEALSKHSRKKKESRGRIIHTQKRERKSKKCLLSFTDTHS